MVSTLGSLVLVLVCAVVASSSSSSFGESQGVIFSHIAYHLALPDRFSVEIQAILWKAALGDRLLEVERSLDFSPLQPRDHSQHKKVRVKG